MNFTFDTANIARLNHSHDCDHAKLLHDVKTAAHMVAKKYRYPYGMVDDVTSESVVFLFTNPARIPDDTAGRVTAYVLALCRGMFRRMMHSTGGNVSYEDVEFKAQVAETVFKEIGDLSGFYDVVNKVMRNYCFYRLMGKDFHPVIVHRPPDLVKRHSYRRLFLNVYNRIRYDKVDNVEEVYKSRGSARPGAAQ